MEKIILTDVDGVLLNWNRGFEEFASSKGFSVVNKNSYYLDERFAIDRNTAESLRNEFCNSSKLKTLEPIGDAPKYVKKLFKEFGYRLVCITKIGRDKFIEDNRVNNLLGIYGMAISKLTCLDSKESKRESLFQYAGQHRIWIEDHIENAQIGAAFGFKTFLIDHEYNKTQKDIGFDRVNGWEEIYNYVCELEKSPPPNIT